MMHPNYIPIKSSYLCTAMGVAIYFAKQSATFFDKALMITAQLVAKTGLKPYICHHQQPKTHASNST